jgi:hypothetical protein
MRLFLCDGGWVINQLWVVAETICFLVLSATNVAEMLTLFNTLPMVSSQGMTFTFLISA